MRAWLCSKGFHGTVTRESGDYEVIVTKEGKSTTSTRVTEHSCGHRVRRSSITSDLRTREVEDIAPLRPTTDPFDPGQ
jgi:hypothetical protein